MSTGNEADKELNKQNHTATPTGNEADKELKNQNHTATPTPSAYLDANPALKLTSVLFNGNNYLSWSEAVLLALGAKSLLNHVTDEHESLATDPLFNQWTAANKLVRLWILNSMEPTIWQLFFRSKSAFDLWQTIKDMFGHQNNFDRIFQLKQELFQSKQGSQSITQLYGSIKSKLDELSIYEPITADIKTIQQRYENDRVYLLLNALNSDYEQLRTQILYSPELPNISNVVSLLQREETRKTMMSLHTQTTDSIVQKSVLIADRNQGGRNFTGTRGKGRGRGNRSQAHCDHCARDGHSRDRCWVLYPHLRPRRDKTGGASQPSAHMAVTASTSDPHKCTIAQLSQLLQQLGNASSLATQWQAAGPSSGIFVDRINQTERNELGLEKECKSLAAHLTRKTPNQVWVVDSGATHHMVNCDAGLTDLTRLATFQNVFLADGSTTPIQGTGQSDQDDDW